MTMKHSRHIEDPNASTPPPRLEVISAVPTPPDHSETMTLLVTLPPRRPGNPPDRRTGSAFGFVENETVFEPEGEPEHVVRAVRAGEGFWEPDGGMIHYQDGNNLADAHTRFLARWS
jgi:hypothetical protein